jgi:CRISPR-associated endoribonuclease Cas6
MKPLSIAHRNENPPGEVGARLNAPSAIVDAPGLAAIWRRGIVTFRLRGLAPLIVDVGLAGRIRGALGTRLALSASAPALSYRPCPWNPPCAFEALWRKQGCLNSGFEHASPWVLDLDVVRGDLEVTLTLFGFANDWLAAAVEAIAAALAHDVDWRGRTGLFVPRIEVVGRRVVETLGIAPPPPATNFVLEFISPLVLTGVDPRERPAILLTGLGQRLEALARWHDVTLGPAFERRALSVRVCDLDYRFRNCDTVSWTRGSRRQDRAIPMRGLIGIMEIGGVSISDAELGLLLALGATCHIGADVAFGCGRYALDLYSCDPWDS